MLWLVIFSSLFSYIGVTQAIRRNRAGKNWFHWAFCSVFAIGGLLFSLAAVVTPGATPVS
ncbi:hypothetical protein IEI94_07645 [Halomonas sp. ML-15]|uniref:hypothetical protein n=1 Tax=Halomonas sp. ML-15 TaxID=2773305 RepID=UPI001746FABE|nr:hypothetical protein [Halomonas sp. ML-15]MBD3895725.1 hypothetical protein [Halomonas sp. ML-15]